MRSALCFLLVLALILILATVYSGYQRNAEELRKDLREKTLSVLNTEADRWSGSKEFATTATDAYGQPLNSSIEKVGVFYVLEVRSNGPDGLPKNSDDIIVNRAKAIPGELGEDVEELTGKAVSGFIKGFKKEINPGGDGGKK